MDWHRIAQYARHAATCLLYAAAGATAILDSCFVQPAGAQQPPGGRRSSGLREPFAVPDLGEPYSPNLEKVIARRIPIEGEKRVIERREELIEFRSNVYRLAITDPNVANYLQYDPKTIGLQGLERGETTFTVWLEDEEQPITMLVRVIQDPETQQIQKRDYLVLEQYVAELFPNSHVRLVPVANKLVVWGQAPNVEEAGAIIALITGGGGNGGDDDSNNNNNNNNGGGGGGGTTSSRRGGTGLGGLIAGTAARVFPGDQNVPQLTVVNMLRVPGEQQVSLKVRIAELNRSALRSISANVSLRLGTDDRLFLQSLLSGGGAGSGNLNATFDAGDVALTMQFLAGNGTAKILAEPNLTTLSGQPATFLVGGEFAVPTAIVGGGGGVAATTQFRGFGTSLFVLPIVLDKDRIRLTITPEFSSVNQGGAVAGVPGLNTRTLSTTVEIREGQTFAVGGLIQETVNNESTRVPYLGDIPLFGTLFRTMKSSHGEQELVILITPELVSPMLPDEVPPLPGFDVTTPTDFELYFKGRTEGHPNSTWRPTVWPINWTRTRDVMETQQQFVQGPSGQSMPWNANPYEAGGSPFGGASPNAGAGNLVYPPGTWNGAYKGSQSSVLGLPPVSGRYAAIPTPAAPPLDWHRGAAAGGFGAGASNDIAPASAQQRMAPGAANRWQR